MKNAYFESLSGSEAFDRVFREGACVRTRSGTVRVRSYVGNKRPETAQAPLPTPGVSGEKKALHPPSRIRIGFVVRKALGSSVERNRARRIARAAVREAWERFQSHQPCGAVPAYPCLSFDIVIQLTTIDVERDELVHSVTQALERSATRARSGGHDVLS